MTLNKTHLRARIFHPLNLLHFYGGRNNQTLRNYLLFPLWLIQGYLTVSVLLFFFGPWPWPVSNAYMLASYLALAQGCMYVGYITANLRTSPTYNGPISAERLTQLCIIGTLIWVPISLHQNSSAIRSGAGIIESVVASSGDLAGFYATKQTELRERGEGIPNRYAILPSVMSVMALPLGLVFWHRLTVKWRTLFVLSRIGELSTWLITGTTKGIADTFILGGLMLVACFPGLANQLRRHWLKCLAIGLVCGSVVFCYFGQAKFGDSVPSDIVDPDLGISANFDNPLLALLSDRNRVIAVLLASYLTQGYFALGEALVAPFEWTYGFGHGSLSWGISEMLGISGIADSSYPGRLEVLDWSRSARWHTLYTWLASDLTFPGTLLAMVLFGRLFALAWNDAVNRENPFGVIMAFLFFQMAIYIPANNQVLGFSASAMAFWVCLPLWLRSRRRNARQRRPALGTRVYI